eukprot:197177-Chlamydomonas_euryale.AAC.2
MNQSNRKRALARTSACGHAARKRGSAEGRPAGLGGGCVRGASGSREQGARGSKGLEGGRGTRGQGGRGPGALA